MEDIKNKENLENQAQENFNLWNEMLQTGDTKKVAELYDNEATFLPTMLGKFLFGQEGAVEYFTHFLEKNPFGKIIEGKIQEINKESYLHSGMYNFEVGPLDKRDTVEARFTFLWNKIDGNWKIIHHHSSLKPKI